jgi:serine/threonine protein phosphatase 1
MRHRRNANARASRVRHNNALSSRLIVPKPFQIQRCRRMPANADGRDFVVGDLHGHRSLLELELDALGFDPACDRVFAVGDLIDRGPESLATLRLIDVPWFHAVLGNHELMLLEYLGYYASRLPSRRAYPAGAGDWAVEAISKHPKAFDKLAARVAALPLALHVEDDVPFNVTHGDLHPIGSRQKALWRSPRIDVHEAEAATSSRIGFGAAMEASLLELRFGRHPVRISASPMGSLPITYAGHSPSRRIVVHDSYVYIDQGVCAATHKRIEPTPPTVVEHRRFARWLDGATAARRCGSPPSAWTRGSAAVPTT